MDAALVSSFLLPLLLTVVVSMILLYCFEDIFMMVFLVMILALVEQSYLLLNFSGNTDIPILFMNAIIIFYSAIKLLTWKSEK